MPPLVSIGVPTYNRPEGVERAVRSVLAQDEADLEVIITDNASTDPATEAAGRRLAAEDARVRYVRNPHNVGPINNFRRVLELAGGEYFMWLSDDDWLDPDYVSRCLAELRADPAVSVACGRARYYRDGEHLVDDTSLSLASPRPGARVLRYYRQVADNGPMFGLMRRSELGEVAFREVLGSDWTVVAAMAANGRVRVLETTHVHRSLAGHGADVSRVGRNDFGLRGLRGRDPYLAIAWSSLRAIGWAEASFGCLGRARRLLVGALAASIVFVRYGESGRIMRALLAIRERSRGPVGT